MTPDAPHPLDLSPAAGRLAVLRVLCGGLAGGLVLVTVLIAVVVQFALDGQPIAGNAVQVAGVSVVTLAAVALAVAAPVAGRVIASAVQRAGVEKLAADPASIDPETTRGRLLDVFAAATFAEFAVAEGTGFVCALLYHLTADKGLLAAVAVLAGYMVLRLPTSARAQAWYDAAATRLGDLRETPSL